jgi:hypothetical protein
MTWQMNMSSMSVSLRIIIIVVGLKFIHSVISNRTTFKQNWYSISFSSRIPPRYFNIFFSYPTPLALFFPPNSVPLHLPALNPSTTILLATPTIAYALLMSSVRPHTHLTKTHRHKTKPPSRNPHPPLDPKPYTHTPGRPRIHARTTPQNPRPRPQNLAHHAPMPQIQRQSMYANTYLPSRSAPVSTRR